jgi:hypothetical protein
MANILLNSMACGSFIDDEWDDEENEIEEIDPYWYAEQMGNMER